MKNRLLFLSAALCLSSCVAPKYSSKTQFPSPFEFQKTENVTGTKEQLFVKANEWMATIYNNANSVIQMHDKEAGVLIGKGEMTSTMHDIVSRIYYIDYTLTIRIKDGKYMATVKDFTIDKMENASSSKCCYSLQIPIDEHAKSNGELIGSTLLNIKGDCQVKSNDLLKSLNNSLNLNSSSF